MEPMWVSPPQTNQKYVQWQPLGTTMNMPQLNLRSRNLNGAANIATCRKTKPASKRILWDVSRAWQYRLNPAQQPIDQCINKMAAVSNPNWSSNVVTAEHFVSTKGTGSFVIKYVWLWMPSIVYTKVATAAVLNAAA